MAGRAESVFAGGSSDASAHQRRSFARSGKGVVLDVSASQARLETNCSSTLTSGSFGVSRIMALACISRFTVLVQRFCIHIVIYNSL
jgi:hypothetical protein